MGQVGFSSFWFLGMKGRGRVGKGGELDGSEG